MKREFGKYADLLPHVFWYQQSTPLILIMASSGEPRQQINEGAKLWGGRFVGKTDPILEEFNSSIKLDQRMWREDIKGSQAYADSLYKVSLLTTDENDMIQDGLKKVYEEWSKGSFIITPEDEDIHTANERRLKELIGSAAGKLHTGRSRNDQVATDMRLWMKAGCKELERHLTTLVSVSLDRAREHISVIMPGYTHLQRAQPIRFSQWLLSYSFMLQRDMARLFDLMKRIDVCPLGSGALAGNPFNIDRKSLGEALGFSEISSNSLDGTSDRDFVVEFLFWASMVSVHLSKLAEDMIIYCTKEFGFISLADAYSTGSSLMPQKKNPDSLELIRGKAGRITGQLSGFMTTLKGLPSTYNKDLQEDKAAMFDVYDNLTGALQVAAGVVATLRVNVDRCQQALSPDMLATDLAYYLVRRGTAFREAHGLAGQCVALAEQKNCQLNELSVSDFHTVSPHFGADVHSIFSYEASVNQYSVTGGTALSAVEQQMEQLETWLRMIQA